MKAVPERSDHCVQVGGQRPRWMSAAVTAPWDPNPVSGNAR